MSILVDIEKKYGSFCLKASFTAADETLALLGASGCGKSLTLKCIAGVERPDRGKIVVDGRTLFNAEERINLPPQQRKIGLMFQNPALFPNFTVLQNICAGAKREKDVRLRNDAVTQMMERFELAELAQRYPFQLSGGQQQRVALARTLVSKPDLLLLDEPFSALDAHLRSRLEQELRNAIQDFGKTVLLVSHDRDEVFRLSDSVAIIGDGRVETIGPKKAVFRNPHTKNGAILTGCKNISRVQRLDGDRVYALDWNLPLKIASAPSNPAYIGIYMHDIRPGMGENTFSCRVEEEIENSFSYTILLRPTVGSGGKPISWELDKGTWQSIRTEVLDVCMPPDAILLLKG